MADKARRKTEKKLTAMEKQVTAIYTRAQTDVGTAWTEYVATSTREIDALQAAYDAAKKSGNEEAKRKAGIKLSKAKRQRTLMNAHYKNLTEKFAAELANVNQTALAYINGNLPEVYAINYNQFAEDSKFVEGYSFELTDPQTVANLATKNAALLPRKKLNIPKDMIWSVRRLNAEVLQGILLGEPMSKIARRMEKVFDMDKKAAIRNARTMVTSAECKGRQDSYETATRDGIVMKKVWISTPGSDRTRDWHLELHHVETDVSEPFINSQGEIRFPGDPAAKPSNVYNCRCSLKSHILGFVPKSQRGKINPDYIPIGGGEK